MATKKNFTLDTFAVFTDQQNRPDERVSKFSEIFFFLCTYTFSEEEER